MTHHPEALVEAVARALCKQRRIDPDEAGILTNARGYVTGWGQQWEAFKPEATATLDARDAWVVANAPFDGGTVTQSRLRKLRNRAARPGAADGQEGVKG